MPATKTTGTIHSATVTRVELGGVLAPNRLGPSVPGTNQKSRFANGTNTSSENQPVMLKSWLRWMVSMIDMTKVAMYASASTASPSPGDSAMRAMAGSTSTNETSML